MRQQGESQAAHKPEYETVMAFSSLLLNDDDQLVYEIGERLNQAGMDSISAGGTVAAAIEWYQQGIITDEHTGGLKLDWGRGSDFNPG